MPDATLLSLDDLISDIQSKATDLSNLCAHFQAGTLETYYSDLRAEAIAQLLLMPARLYLSDQQFDDDADSVLDSVKLIADALASVGDRTSNQVQQEMMRAVKQFPTDDVRQSTYLQRNNLLN